MSNPHDLRQAAQAVVDRWDTPHWKDAPATANYINALRAALASQPAAPADVPGWKLVPIEPTPEMALAFWSMHDRAKAPGGSRRTDFRGAYSAMLAASPLPPPHESVHLTPASSETVQAAGWQPIATAPKDGTEIVGAEWQRLEGPMELFTAETAFTRGAWRYESGEEWSPTSWMPKPPEPQDTVHLGQPSGDAATGDRP